MNELALFAGAGGGILGGHLLGWRTICAVEWEAYPASVLVARQNDKILSPFPIWDDVQTFDGKPWRGIVDVVSGGFPCQDISVAGKGDGLDGERSGMWREMARIIGEVRPRYAFVENSPMLTSRGLGTVLRDLAQLGYDAEWGVLGANDVGANHRRKRIWIMGYTNNYGTYETNDQSILERKSNRQKTKIKQFKRSSISELANTKKLFSNGSNNNSRISMEQEKKLEFGNNCWSKNVSNSQYRRLEKQRKYEQSINTTQSGDWQTSFPEYGSSSNFWAIEPNVDRVANGVAARVDRLKAIGNGQVPLCAATAWNILKGRIDD